MMFCINCGNELSVEAKYCPNCGTSTKTGNAQSSDTEAYLGKKKFTVQQASALSFCVVLTAWGLLPIVNSLLPHITCQILNDFSSHVFFEDAYLILYFVFSVMVCVRFHVSIKAAEYIKTSQYKLIDALAVKESSGLQMWIFGLILLRRISRNMENKQGLFDVSWLNISVIVLILCGVMWVLLFFLFKAIRQDDIKMIKTTIYISFREFLVSILIAIGLCYLISDESDHTIIALGTLVLIFVYPVVRFMQTKRILKNVFHIK